LALSFDSTVSEMESIRVSCQGSKNQKKKNGGIQNQKKKKKKFDFDTIRR